MLPTGNISWKPGGSHRFLSTRSVKGSPKRRRKGILRVLAKLSETQRPSTCGYLMTPLILTVIVLTVTLTACAQLALKLAVSTPEATRMVESYENFLSMFLSGGTILGLSMYVLSVVAWLWVLSRVDLTVAYPFVGLSFVITPFSLVRFSLANPSLF